MILKRKRFIRGLRYKRVKIIDQGKYICDFYECVGKRAAISNHVCLKCREINDRLVWVSGLNYYVYDS